LTPEDQALDPNFFLTQQPLTLYRLARARYANLSGVGAALAPGRWNRAGEEAIYTSTEMAVPVLERLAHARKDLIPSNLAQMKIRIMGRWAAQGRTLHDPDTGGALRIYRTLSEARDFFHNSHIGGFRGDLNPFAIAVPSVIVPVWNIVLFPQGTGFWEHVSLESVELFEFDPRLFPENAAVEAEQK
jgi:RES domain-containing protein